MYKIILQKYIIDGNHESTLERAIYMPYIPQIGTRLINHNPLLDETIEEITFDLDSQNIIARVRFILAKNLKLQVHNHAKQGWQQIQLKKLHP